MKPTLLLYKKPGETPLQAINKVREEYPSLQDKKISMAGRLDPMAEGLLLLLIGDENKKRMTYEGLSKVYEFTVVFGIETDSYDGLGVIQSYSPSLALRKTDILDVLNIYKGTTQQAFPPFSSKPFRGKPLYYWSRKEKIKEEDLPTKEITITDLSLISLETVILRDIAENIISRIKTIQGTFRQEQIISQWQQIINTESAETIPLARFRIACSSGTYVRGIAHDLGKKLNVGAFAYTIIRTHIGDLTVTNLDRSLA